jgi:hypothetical protein
MLFSQENSAVYKPIKINLDLLVVVSSKLRYKSGKKRMQQNLRRNTNLLMGQLI